MADVNKLIQILNRREFGGSGKETNTDKKGDNGGGKKVKGTGLVLYAGGKEKTPTGESNAFANSGLTEDDLLKFAKENNLPTSSNKEFQKGLFELMNSTTAGRLALSRMDKKFGKSKAGNYDDGLLGARTVAMMQSTPPPGGVPIIPREPGKIPTTPPPDKIIPNELPTIPQEETGDYRVFWSGPKGNLSNPNGKGGLKLNRYRDLQYVINEAAKRGIEPGGYTYHGTGRTNSISNNVGSDRQALKNGDPKSADVYLPYAFDVFSAYDLPQDEELYSAADWNLGKFNSEEEYKRERTKIPLGIIDQKTGKLIPAETDPTEDPWKYAYIKAAVDKYPELFDLNKSANMVPKKIFESQYGTSGLGNRDRDVIDEPNQFHPGVDSESPRYQWKNKGRGGETGLYKWDNPNNYLSGATVDRSTPVLPKEKFEENVNRIRQKQQLRKQKEEEQKIISENVLSGLKVGMQKQ